MKTLTRFLTVFFLLLAPLAHGATITVNSTADPAGFNPNITIPHLSVTITLRDAVNAVRNTGGTHTITFAPGLAGQTIYLSHAGDTSGTTALLLNGAGASANDLTIQGLTGNTGVTIARDPSGVRMGLFLCLGSNSSVTVNDLTFSGGDKAYSNGWGGAFNVIGTSVTMNRCTLTGNKASLGGAIYMRDSTLNVTNCTIAGNNAYDQGGGIYYYVGGSMTLIHTTITNNNAGRGGGLFTYNGGDLLVNTIVAGNSAYSLFGNDISGNGAAAVSSSSLHNLIGNAASSGGLSNGVNNNIVGVNALLNGLANDGGPSPTVALSAGSPALNAAAPGVVSADQRGISRPQGAGADMGAYEIVDGAPTTFTSPSSTTFVIAFNNSLNVTANGVPSPNFSLSGALPAGVTLTAAGLLSGNPSAGTEGIYPLTIAASNNAGMTMQSFTLTVIRAVVVTTATDEDNGSTNPALGTGTSLREAISYAATLPGPRTITFASSLAGQLIDLTITGDTALGPSALRINTNITIQGLTGNGGITIRRATSGSLRPFLVFFDATLTLNDLTIADGLASQGGGIFNFGTLRMNRCTLRNNIATFKGGGLLSGGGGSGQQVTLTNCTLANNRAQFTGGAIANDGTSTLNLTNVTVAANTSPNNAGLDIAGTVVAINSIVAGNTNPSGASDVGGTLSAGSHHNLIGTGGSGGLVNGVNGNIVGVQNPRLGALASNGGPTQTVALVGSPAVNAGATVTGVTTDQRGVLRPQHGVPDIGAYEFNGTVAESLVVTTAVDESEFTSDPGFGTGTSLREALSYATLLGGAQTITFSPSLTGQTVTVSDGWNGTSDDTALRTSTDVTIDGGAGVTIHLNSPTPRRIFGCTGGTLTLRNLTLSGGDIRGTDNGGALWSNATVNITNVRFTNNCANNGGAIMSFGTLAISGSTFDNNATAADGQGGAIWSNNTLGVSGCTFHLNTAAVLGGAIASFQGLTVSDSTFSTNHSDFNGGALRLDGTAVISGSTFSNNTAVNGGGALISHGTTTLTNTTIANNAALDGGGAQFFDGTASLRHLTITNNAASRSGGGLVVSFANVTMTNTIVAGNSAPDQNNLWGGPLNASSSNNLINTNPAQLSLGSLANNGGPTATIALQPGSLAIDAGVAIAGLTSDQRGTARPQGDGTDVGAFELVPSQAANIPIISPVGGTHQNSLQITISNTSQGATVRYTLDGSTPSAMAYGAGWTASPIASVNFNVLGSLPFWRNVQGLPPDGSQDLATPAGDGVANLLKYAFNLAPNAGDLSKPNVTILPQNGAAGLPFIGIDGQGRLVLEFVRRKASSNPGAACIVETGADFANLSPLDLGPASVVSIDTKWERVTVTDPTITPQRFGRVRILIFSPYVNDFNAGLGAASVRGSAVWSNGAVMLTDTVGGQEGAVVFDGIVTSPALNGFTARFNLTLGPTTTGIPADGVSFAVGNLPAGTWNEGGPGTSQTLAVGFDTYDNGGNGAIGIHIWVNGTHLAFDATNPYSNGAPVPVEISYDATGGLTLRYNSALIFNHLAIPSFSFPPAGRFGLGARTGGANERAVVDDVEISPR